QVRRSAGVGAILQIGSRTRLTTAFDSQRLEFDQSATTIAEALDRQSNITSAALALDVTPLTTFVLQTDYQEDRFLRSSLRDSNAMGVVGGFELKPFALISGSGVVGFRHL